MRSPLNLTICAVCLGLRSSAVTVLAGSPSTPAVAPVEARQFDFWIGEWEVFSPDGKRAGTSRIESVANGRGVLETWTGNPASGSFTGRSLNAWNPEKKRWQQFWIGSDGVVLELAGGLDEKGQMVLSSEHGLNQERVMERITWSANPDGSMRQLWEQSVDRGANWKIVFDGRYVKRGVAAAPGANQTRALLYLFQ